MSTRRTFLRGAFIKAAVCLIAGCVIGTGCMAGRVRASKDSSADLPPYVSTALAQHSVRGLGVAPDTAVAGCEYRILYTRLLDSARGVRYVHIMTITASPSSAAMNLIVDGTVHAMVIRIHLPDGRSEVVKEASQVLSTEDLRKWFDILHESEIFSLPPVAVRATDDGLMSFRLYSRRWVFERTLQGKTTYVMREWCKGSPIRSAAEFSEGLFRAMGIGEFDAKDGAIANDDSGSSKSQ